MNPFLAPCGHPGIPVTVNYVTCPTCDGKPKAKTVEAFYPDGTHRIRARGPTISFDKLGRAVFTLHTETQELKVDLIFTASRTVVYENDDAWRRAEIAKRIVEHMENYMPSLLVGYFIIVTHTCPLDYNAVHRLIAEDKFHTVDLTVQSHTDSPTTYHWDSVKQ